MQSEVKKHANAGRIYNVHTSKNFTIISNEVIRSEHLELDEKGFLFYLLSLPDDWVIYKSSLPKLMGEKEGRVDRIFKILQEKGYIVSQKITDEKNRFVGWTHSVSSVITEFSREGVFSVSGNPEVGKSTPIQRDISIQKKISPILDSPNQGPTQISQMAATQQIYGGPVKKKVKTEPRNALKESELAVQKGLIKWLLDPDFIESLQLWFDYKHERKEGYMDKGLAALFGKISKFTKQEVMTAIEESMSSNWAGLFPKSNSKSDRKSVV